MKLTNILLFSALLLAFTSVRANGASLVTNGSFEQGALGIGSFQGWQTSLGDSTTFVDSSNQNGPLYGEAFDGLWSAYFGSTAADGGASISQILATTVGQGYVLTFELANDNLGLTPGNGFSVTLGGKTAYSFTNVADQADVAYQFSFIASSSATPLTFLGSNDNSYFELDDVAVASTPEPGSLALLLAGVPLTFLFFRRRSGNGR
jgi:hypothetical protein